MWRFTPGAAPRYSIRMASAEQDGGDQEPRPAPVKILVCVGPRCDAQGEGRALLACITQAVESAFAAQERVSVSTRDCLRLCTSGPMLRIDPLGEVFCAPSAQSVVALISAALR